jgi:surface carbohydrate biosynthesis protein
MLQNFFKNIKKIIKIKLHFHLPKKKNLLLYDEIHSSTLKEIVRKNFNVLKTREKEIYLWIFLKQIIYLDLKFSTYCKNYIKFTSPKIVITFNDRKPEFYRLKDTFKHINFISVQNGVHDPSFFKRYNFENFNCDYFFVLNEHFIRSYKKYINSKYIVLGNFQNNIVKINKSNSNDNFLLISQFDKPESNIKLYNFYLKLLKFINLYFLKSNKKINILLRCKDHTQKEEIAFYKKIFQSNCIFQKSNDWKKSYQILDKFENILFMHSTLGYESIARKKKVAIFTPSRISINSSSKEENFKYWFGWPAPYQKKYDFFTSRDLSYNEVKRVINNIKNCDQVTWEKKYYRILKNQLYLNKYNSKLKKIIFNLL